MQRRLGLAIATLLAYSAPALAQQPLCIPGTPYCLPTQVNGQVGGGANGQVGPNGANGNAHGNANGQVQQPAPPPTYRPPPPPPPTYTPPPAPPPTYVPPPPLAPPPSPPPPAYEPPFRPRDPQSPGIGIYPVVRVGKDSGFHVGGSLSFGLHEQYWGFELDTMVLRGGMVTTTDLSFVPSFVVRFGADDDAETYNGLYARLGPEFRFSFPGDRSMSEQMFHIGVQAGVGYERTIARDVSWRILDVRLFGAWRTDSLDVPDDELGHKTEYGLLFASGITFY